jgi:hypothetical protein
LFLLLQSPFLSYFLSFFHFIVSFSSSFISFRSFIFFPSISSPSQYPLQPPVSPTTWFDLQDRKPLQQWSSLQSASTHLKEYTQGFRLGTERSK